MIPKELFYQIFLYEFRFNLLGYFRLFYLNLKFVDLIFDLIFSLNFLLNFFGSSLLFNFLIISYIKSFLI